MLETQKVWKDLGLGDSVLEVRLKLMILINLTNPMLQQTCIMESFQLC